MTENRNHTSPRYFTKEEKEIIRREYPDGNTKEIAEKIGRSETAVRCQAFSMGVKKSMQVRIESTRKAYKTNYNLHKAPNYWKGRKMTPEEKKIRNAQVFKKGHVPQNKTPLGGEIVGSSKGRKFTRVMTENGLVYKSRLVWEKHHGPLPKGCIVLHLNGNSLDDRIENLKAISRVELMGLNSFKNIPTELKNTIRKLSKLKRIIKKKENGKIDN